MPADKEGPNEKIKRDPTNIRVGNVSEDNYMWDNGLYTECQILGTPAVFLVDNGSSATLLSYQIFEKIRETEKPYLSPVTNKILGANGQEIKVYGQATLEIMMGDVMYKQLTLVCDIMPDGILGQDFLLKHATGIDYRSICIYTPQTKIPCWIGGEAEGRCQIITKSNICIPPSSGIVSTVTIPNVQMLSKVVLLMTLPSIAKSKSTYLVEGITDLPGEDVEVHLINAGEEEINIPANVPIGFCESYYEADATETVTCNHINTNSQKDGVKIPTHLEDLLERSSTGLTSSEKDKLAHLLAKYQHVFARSSEDLGQTNIVQHKINTGSAIPIRQPPRRQPIGKRDTEKEEIKKMLAKGVIEPSHSSWASPVVLITKKDGSTRFCVDYRRLNDVTIKDAYPIPRVDECLDALTGSKWFSTVDLNSGFWQVALDMSDKDKTAFGTTLGLYQFTVMPFGLVNAPSTFERLMENVMRGLQWEECLIYMDDVIVPATSFDEGLLRLEHVLQRLEGAQLKLKPSKCTLFRPSVKFLGHIVSEEGVGTDEEKIAAVKDWPVPSTRKHVRSFLGLCSYYRRFVENFAAIARPLHKLCEKQVKFQWSSEANEAFQLLKQSLTQSPILAYPQLGQRFILDTDASDFAVGGVLSQEQDGKERVIAYMSKSQSQHERVYCVTRKELLAVIVALKKFHTYLYGQKVLLRTDNAAVSWMKNLKTPTGQMARWIQELGTYDLEIVHRQGRKHSNADALSRKPCKVCKRYAEQDGALDQPTNETIDEEPLYVCAVTRSQTIPRKIPELLEGWDSTVIIQNQTDDEDIGPIFKVLLEDKGKPQWGDISGDSAHTKAIWNQWDRLEVQEGLLHRKPDTENDNLQLVVPTPQREDLMKLYHDIPSAGHLGWKTVLDKVRRDFYWPGMKEYIISYCTSCDTCAARKPCRSKNRAPLGKLLTGAPMEKVGIDVLGPLTRTDNGNKYILVMCDLFTKWTEAFPMADQESSTIAKIVVNNFISRFGCPLQLHSDQGRSFEAKLFKDMCTLFGITKTRSTSFRPQSNGTVERFNRTLAGMLTAYCSANQNKWDEYLPQVLMAYRASIHSSTGVTPNMMTLGRNVILPSQAVIGLPEDSKTPVEPDNYVSELNRNMVQIHAQARKTMKKQALYRKKYYDAKAKTRHLEDKTLVWLHDPTRKPGICNKLSNRWKGPYEIVKRLDDLIYIIKTSEKKPVKAVHIDRLLPYKGRNRPSWIKS